MQVHLGAERGLEMSRKYEQAKTSMIHFRRADYDKNID